MNSRSSTRDRDSESRRIEEEAAAWFGRCEVGLTPEQQDEFIRWIEADERHRLAARSMDETWEFLDGMKDIDRWAPSTPQGSEKMRRINPPAVFRLLLATAAVLAILLAGIWQPWQETPFVRKAATAAGGMRKIELPDGSNLHLNANSAVEVRYTQALRQVRLSRGETHFVVASDAARPFVVTAGAVAVKAVGTAFNVRREAQSVEVFVTEGRVVLNDVTHGSSLLLSSPEAAGHAPDSTIAASSAAAPDVAGLLTAGQRAIVPVSGTATPAAAVIAPIAPAEIRQELAWQERLLEFDLTPLSEVVAEFNRYNSHQLVIEHAGLGQQLFGGAFRADNYSAFVLLLEQRFGVVAERRGEKTILRPVK